MSISPRTRRACGRVVGIAAAVLLLSAVAGEALAASCGAEEREVRSAEAEVELSRLDLIDRERTLGYNDELRQRGPDVGYRPPAWLRAETLASLERGRANLSRARARLQTAQEILRSCRVWAWRDAGSPTSGGPVAGYVPRGEPGRSALRDDMIGDLSPGGSSRPYRRAYRDRESGPLGADPRDRQAWRNDRTDYRRDRGDGRRDRADNRRDRADDRRDRKRDARGDGRRRSGSGPHRAPDTPFYDPPQ